MTPGTRGGGCSDHNGDIPDCYTPADDHEWFGGMLNNRDWALLIWLGTTLIWLVVWHPGRALLAGIAKAGAKPAIVLSLLALAGYVALEVLVGSLVSLWRGDFAKDTVLWFVMSGLGLFLGFQRVSKERHFFRREIRTAFAITVFLEFFVNLSVFSLPEELALQLVLFVLGTAVALGADQRFWILKDSASPILACIYVFILVFVAIDVSNRWNELDKQVALLQLLLPMWLTLGLLPFVYMFSLYANYESLFKGVDHMTSDKRGRMRARAALLTSLHLRARDSGSINWFQAGQLAEAASVREARRKIKEFQASRRAKEQAEIEAQERLRRYAGSDETDREGRRLDRREFKETTDALRWLATCQLGWYERSGNRYPTDLLTRFGPDFFTMKGLPTPSGVVMEVSNDGQSWYGWRRTITGWYFAIGAAGPPPNQWQYDGEDPPGGFPGQDPSWGTDPFSNELSRNWS